MAESDSTLGYRFAESKILAKTYNLHSSKHFRPESRADLSIFINNDLPGMLETMRSQVNHLMSLPLPVRKKSRLLLIYWEFEIMIEEILLLLDQRLSP